jgi:hypothetical protein
MTIAVSLAVVVPIAWLAVVVHRAGYGYRHARSAQRRRGCRRQC